MRVKRQLVYLILSIVWSPLLAQNRNKPKLVVGIVIDQMRYDYLEKFEKYFSKNGFVRLMNEGANFKNVHYNYKPTYTAPGHASIFTGATPSVHGIVGNDWYSHEEKLEVYCVADSMVLLSPIRMKAESIADVIKKNQKVNLLELL